MAKVISIKKGLTLNLKGKAPKEMLKSPAPASSYAVVPDDFVGVIPKVIVHPGDKVLAGQPLMYHKRFPSIQLTSPVSGEVVAVNRGAKRKVLNVEVKPDGNQEYKSFDVANISSKDRGSIMSLLLESGLFAFFKQRPYDIVPNPDFAPRDIFITANFTAPLAPDFDFLAEGYENYIQLALDALSKLTDGKVFLGVNGKTLIDIRGVERVEINGPHPAGLVGVLINKTKPVNKDEVVWTLKASDLIVIGKFLTTGKVDYTRTLAMTGSDAMEHGYVSMLPGAKIEESFSGRLCVKPSHERIIDGNVLTGKKVWEEDPFMSLQCDQITVIPEGDDVHDMFGWATLGFDKFSTSRSYFSWLAPKSKEYVMDARVKGGVRAMILSNQFSEVFPMDIMPEFLLKSIIVFNINDMENRGVYEVAPEDFALCEFVDASKMPLQKIVRDGLDNLYKEMI
ncbi:Na(+)-translocating NADH-quinone reductase subunit A [Porphyromonas pogonae]|uniref:Na(+)-translocating NADH-quinone reductase subunit A n=1 Tax=Porphyromonas pogonae TaxID=867595 RepID=UPI002E78581C|nr:Na(+)-translocating NADH-quinone reductase subunit A [Porphyromonas pogonae]